MIYNLSDTLDRERAQTKWDALLQKGAMVELTEQRKRSLNQNSYLHVLLGVLAMEFGETIEYCKQMIFKRLVNPQTFIQKVNDKFVGETQVLRSSRDLTTEEMSVCIDRLKKWAYEQGIYLPEAGEADKIALIQWQIAKFSRLI